MYGLLTKGEVKILAKLIFFVFMDRDEHKLTQKKKRTSFIDRTSLVNKGLNKICYKAFREIFIAGYSRPNKLKD